MELTVTERLILLDLLPREGTYATLKLIRTLREDLSFSDEENQQLKFWQDGIQLHWDDQVAVEIGTKDVEMARTMVETVLGKFKAFDEAEKLQMDHLPLYERFLGLEEEQVKERQGVEDRLAKLLEG